MDATAINAIFTLNPTTVLTVRYGFNRFPNVTDYVDRGFNQTKLGFPASYVNALQVAEFPSITLSGRRRDRRRIRPFERCVFIEKPIVQRFQIRG